jgi:hypothetical protein
MRGRLGVLIGFGAGYVLGAKAGRERYEQLSRLYDNLLASPPVRQMTGKAREAVDAGIEQAKGVASEGVHKVTDAVRHKREDDRHAGLSVAPPPAQ